MRRSSFTLSLTMVVGSIALFASVAQADPITYRFSGFASGSLGESSFTERAFSFDLVGDSDNVSGFFGPGILSNLPLPASFVINGTAGTLNAPVYVFVNHNLSAAGFGIAGPLIDMHQDQLAGYNMLQAFNAGPGTLNFSDVNNVGTSVGNLTFTSVSAPTFAAIGGIAAPEPGTIALALPALGMLGAVVIRRKK